MEFSPALAAQLTELSEVLASDGPDLQLVLEMLVVDLSAAIPSFVGLTITLHASGHPITFSTLHPAQPGIARTSLMLPLSLMNDTNPGTTVIFFAANPGAFIDLAADTRWAYQLDGHVELDQHLPGSHGDGALPHLPAEPAVTGMDALVAVNQAIGVLIARGHSAKDAEAELRRLAAGRRTVHAVAEILLAGLV